MVARNPPNIIEQNMMARRLVVGTGRRMFQPIYQQTLSGSALGQTINIVPRNVGLITGFVVEISGTITAGVGETLSRTGHGPANILSNITYTDYSNQVRINDAGWHLYLLSSARRRSTAGAAYTNTSPSGYALNLWPVQAFPVTIAPTVASPVRWVYEVPLAYSDVDLRGAVYGGVVNATSQLQLTINPQLAVGNTVDNTLSGYASNLAAALATFTAVTVTVYQAYIDQLPTDKGGLPILPMLDLSQSYQLQSTVMTGLVAGLDNAIPYANFRHFLSTAQIYTQGGPVVNTAFGTDINYWALQTANGTQVWRKSPLTMAYDARSVLGNDLPPGTYYYESRAQPLDTVTYGNLQLIVNPIAALPATAVYVGYEMIANLYNLSAAGALPNT